MAVVKHMERPGVRNLKEALKGLGDVDAKVGWFESSKYEDGTPVAAVAYVQEFGSTKRGIPPRPFFRTTAIEKRGEWAKTAEAISRAVVQGKVKPAAIGEALALAAEGHVRTTITKLTAPALSPITIELRRIRRNGGKVSGKTVGEAAKASKSGFFEAPTGSEAKPLVDTGYLLATLSSQFGGNEK